MALIILQPNAGSSKYLGSGTDVDNIFGATGDETVWIAADGKVVLDPSFSAGGDIIHINGLAGDYQVKVDGSNVVLTNSGGASITIPAGAHGVDVVFTDDTRELVISGGGLFLGDQNIPANGTVVDVTPGDTPPPADGDTFRLEVGQDTLTGTDGDDTFIARVVQNNDGFQANQLGSGDILDGGDGHDVLDARIQGATPIGGSVGSTTIAPETTDIEVVGLRAVKVSGALSDVDPEDLPGLFFGELGPRIGVQVDASDMLGVEEIGSIQSDESLTIFDMTTLADDGETIRNTSDITVRMDHTSNNSSAGAASDLTVLFDRDYLVCDNELPTGGQLFLEMMDLDAAILLQNGQTVYPAGRPNEGLHIDGPLDDSPYNQINFKLGGVERSLTIGNSYNTYPELLAAVQAAIASQPDLNGSLPGGANLIASLGPSFVANDTDSDPGGSATGTTIVLTNVGNDSQFTDVTLDSDNPGIPGDKDFHLQPYFQAPEGEECVIEVDVVLDKVGRGGDGGQLTIGGMTPDLDNVWDKDSQHGLGELARGVEQFNVTVEGNDSEDSSVANMRSTDNWLRTIVIADEGNSDADLVIGNRNTTYDGFDPFLGFESLGLPPGIPIGALGNFSLYQFLNGGGVISDFIEYFADLSDPISWDLSTVKNNAVKDVLTFDASAFDNDTEVHGYFSDEVVDKYLNISDTDASDGSPPNATPDNAQGDAMWTFGEGQNIVNVNINQENMAVEGSATREDFSFNVFTNGGDDLVQIQLGAGVGTCEDRGDGQPNEVSNLNPTPEIQAWYHNHILNENLYINSGSGNDKVQVWGSSAADIDLGDGDDVVFVDNSGVEQNVLGVIAGVGEVYNDGRATWTFNTLNQPDPDASPNGPDDIDNLISDLPTQINKVANLQLRVSFQGVESKWVEVGDSFGSISGETISDLDIVQAIKAAIAAEIGSDGVNQGTLSLSDLLAAEDGPSRSLVLRSLIDGVHDMGDIKIELSTSSPLTAGQIAGGATTFNTATGLGELGFDGLGQQLVGERFESVFGVDTDGSGVLNGVDSSNVNNNNVEGGLGNDLIVLTSEGHSIETVDINGVFGEDVILNFTAGTAEVLTEQQTITFTDANAVEGTVAVTLDGVVYTVQIGGAGEPTTLAEIATAVAAAITAGTGFTASAAGAVVTVTADQPGVDYAQATVDFTADGPEVQNVDISGLATGVTSVSMTFGGVTNTVAVTGADTDITIANALQAAFAADGFTVGYTAGDSDFDITNTQGGDIPLATFNIQGTNIVLQALATETTPGEDPVTGATVATTEDGAIINSGGFDIFDVTTVIGGQVNNLINHQPTLAPGNGDGLEHGAIGSLVANQGWVGIIDTVEVNDIPTATAGMSELQLIQLSANIADAAGGAGTVSKSIAITVNDDNVGTFYLINDGANAHDVVVTRLGSVELGQYGVTGKEAIGDWDDMSIFNFDPLSASQLASSYAGVCNDIV